MADIYRASDGDTIDLIAWRRYGRQDQVIINLILSANPEIADFGPVIPGGLVVVLPDPPVASTSQGVRLWD